MKIFLNSFTAQWKLFIRDKVNWLFAALVLVVVLCMNPIPTLPETTALGYAENAATSVGYFGSLFFVILYLRFFLNETAAGHSYLWGRNSFGDHYLPVKAAVGAAGFLTLIAPTFCVVFVLSLAFYGFANTLGTIGPWLLILLPTICFVIGLCSLIGLLINRVLIASGLIIVYLGFVLTRPVNLGNLLIFMPSLQMNSALIGFGPETEMFVYQRLFYVSVSLFWLAVALVLADLRLPRVRPKHGWITAASIAVLGGAALALAFRSGSEVLNLQRLRSAEPDLQTRQSLEAACADFQSYRLRLELAADGTVASGLAEVVLPSGRDLSALSLLNSGLVVDRFTISKGDPLRVELQYHGSFVVPYYAYTVYGVPKEIGRVGYAPGAYLEKNLIFLQKQGEWHPYALCEPDEITLSMPDNITVNYSSADAEAVNSGLRQLQWQQPSAEILLIAGANYQAEEEEDLRVYLSQDAGRRENTRNAQYGAFFQLARQHLSEMEGSGFALIPLPLIKQSFLESQTRTLIIPERSTQIDYLWLSDPARYSHNVAMDVLQAWWCRQQACPDVASELFSQGSDDIYSYTQGGEASEAEQKDTSSLPLLYYAGMKLAEEAEVPGFDREALLEPYRKLQANRDEQVFPSFIFGWEDQETLLALVDFDAQYGTEAFWELFRTANEKASGGWIEKDALLELIASLSEQANDFKPGACNENEAISSFGVL